MKYKNWRDLITPKSLQVDQETLTSEYGKFTIEPLEIGYGVTLGNALRRVLLSSLQGAAITSLHVDGIQHEFSTIPGVVEDVTRIVLNMKGVRLKMFVDKPKTLSLDIQGADKQEVTAGDIITDHNVKILNPDHHIATLNEDAVLKMTMTTETGKGYVPAGQAEEKRKFPLGTIVIDGVFSPIKKMTYVVSNARVGQQTDYDKLTIQIWTDGSVTPDDALAYGAKILKEQLSVFINFDESCEPPVEVEIENEAPKPVINENLYRSVDELELSVRSANCLKNANIRLIGELVQKTEAEMLTTKNFGRKSLNEIKDILSQMGLSLGVKVTDFDPENAEMIKKVMIDDYEE
ncbi:MAG: DNA-directed RNA polymerase subunit alpha [Deltaproteobacteria bacterium]|nr:MAG: DNA-directed RNA polymerase subunit alpha [Deltaproteobacteria bacterium]